MKNHSFRILFFLLACIVFLPSGLVYAQDDKQEAMAFVDENQAVEETSEEASNVEPAEDPVPIVKNGWWEEDGERYYYVNDARQTGWLKTEDGTYYLNKSGVALKDQWISNNGNWYYLGSDYRMATNIWQTDSGGVCFLLDSGRAARSQWIYWSGDWFYIKSDYHMASNEWQRDSSGWCFLLSGGEAAKNQWVYWSGHWYYLKSDCRMAANAWQKDSTGWCYLLGSGKAAKTQWLFWHNNWYYLKSDYHMASNEWQRDSNGWCYLLSGGEAAKSQWVYWSSHWYYLKASTHMAASEWVRDGNAFYWMNSAGVYTFKHDSSAKAQAYASNTSYLILVDRNAHFVTIYQGSKNHWTLLMGFACGDGKASTPTITGQFSIPNKYPRSQPYFDSGSARCWYPTRISGGYLFHSVLYYQTGSPSRIMDGTLGKGVSHGCVRLALNNAKWIYDNIPIGTKVVIY